MNRGLLAAILALTLLSTAAGIPKVLALTTEVEFFRSFGVENFLIPFGALQILGAILVAPRTTRLAGIILCGVLFAGSATMVAVSGQLGFFLVSILPVLLAVFVVWRLFRSGSMRSTPSPPQQLTQPGARPNERHPRDR